MKNYMILNKHKKESRFPLIIYFILTAIITVSMAFVVKMIMSEIMGVGNRVTSGNRGDYLNIFAIHCSIVFLTTSLMAVLSEKNKYVYWIDIVSAVLILPNFLSFYALSVGSISTVLFAMIGFIGGVGEIIIGSFVIGLLLITILFRRMMSIYYQKDYHKEKIKAELIASVKEKDYLDYLEHIIQLKDITYLKAREREIEDTFDNLCLFESVIEEYWKKIRGKKVTYFILLARLNRYMLIYCRIYLWNIHKKFVIILGNTTARIR